MIKIKSRQVIEVQDFDDLVQETYGRPYSFQQQDGCKSRGTCGISIPSEETNDYENDTVTDNILWGIGRGVSFAAWLARDPNEWYGAPEDKKSWSIKLFWYRNFYPDIRMVVNDLHAKGLIPAGKYMIIIDW